MLRGGSQPSSQQRQEDDAKSRRLRTQYRKLEETIQRASRARCAGPGAPCVPDLGSQARPQNAGKATDISDLTRDDLNQTLDEANALRAEGAHRPTQLCVAAKMSWRSVPCVTQPQLGRSWGAVARAREGVEDSKCFAVICDKGAEGARKLVSGGRVRHGLLQKSSEAVHVLTGGLVWSQWLCTSCSSLRGRARAAENLANNCASLSTQCCTYVGCLSNGSCTSKAGSRGSCYWGRTFHGA